MTNQQKARRKAFRRGIHAEWLAGFYLNAKGYRIIARRYKTRLGEIDLIARRKNLVLIVEVKARKTLQAAHDSVDQTAQKRIESAADLWLSQQKDAARLSLRFDLVIIRRWRWPHHIPTFFTT